MASPKAKSVPTPAQRAVLERLAKGYRLYSSTPDFFAWFQEEVGQQNPLRPTNATLHVLHREGWVERCSDPKTPFWRVDRVITDKGREVLA